MTYETNTKITSDKNYSNYDATSGKLSVPVQYVTSFIKDSLVMISGTHKTHSTGCYFNHNCTK